jgi:uncharacterized protein (DUF1697 family)
MNRYIALLRGVNVGGKAKVSMADLKRALETAGFSEVKTYINSGNIVFASDSSDSAQLGKKIESVIERTFGFHVDAVVITKHEWTAIVRQAPKWWGHDETRKHNLIILCKPYDMQAIMSAIGVLKTDIESAEPGPGVIYQSLSLKDFGKTTSGKLASSPLYKRMTIRNYNTAQKIFSLLEE